MRYYKETPIGPVALECEDGFLTKLSLNQKVDESRPQGELPAVIAEAFLQLDEYFAGKRKKFDLPLKPAGSAFMKRVWTSLAKIPYGQTASYKDIAILTGNSRAVRAVGLANNRNPIPIIIPCHRVIGTSGKLIGYAGGVDMKRALLDLEKSNS